MAKISGYELTRAWFDFVFESEGITANHTALYIFLCEINNRLGWKASFQITASECMAGMTCKSYNTYKKCLDDLIKHGFVKMVTKSANQYRCNVIALSTFDRSLYKALDRSLMNHLTNQSEITGQITGDIQKPQTTKPTKPKTIFCPPTENEVYNFMGEWNVKSHKEWPEAKLTTEAAKFFFHYQSNGWVSGKSKIKDWKSAAQKWMLNDFSGQKTNSQKSHTEQQQHGKQQIADLMRAADSIIAAANNP